jgi:polyisoprenoid-binding protein YceI
MAGSRRRTLGIIAGVAVLVVAAVGFAGWWFLIRDDAPPEADIDTAGRTLDEEASGGASDDAAGGIDGTWTVDTSVGSFEDFSGTWAGYRVEEELAGIGGNTAVGRTPNVTGTMTVAGDEVTAVDVDVDLTTLQSDSGTRDGALRSRGLESDRFPTATFSLTQPLALPVGADTGERVTAQATGDLTIHGVTRQVEIPLQAQLVNDTMVVVGSLDLTFSDYDVEVPQSPIVLSVDDQGTLELQLLLTRA